jgi:hypothetical protein
MPPLKSKLDYQPNQYYVMNKIIGQVIALTKNISLNNPDNSTTNMEQFYVGKRDPYRSSGGLGISWWYKPIAYKIIENISFMITSKINEFSECDHLSIQKIIRKTLHEVCVDKSIFNGDDVCFSRKDSLFDCKSENNTIQFASSIFESILANIRMEISSCCIVYSAPRITGDSFSIDHEKVHLIHKNDFSAWENISKKGYISNELDIKTGCYTSGTKSTFAMLKYDYLFVVETCGTPNGNKFSASLRLRKLFSVIFSLVTYKYRHKVMAAPNSMCLLIPHIESPEKSYVESKIGDLLPYYSDDLKLNDIDIFNIKRWYESELLLSTEQKSRIEKCAHYINKGMNTSDIDSYMHFFIALDALYGRKGCVSKSIEDGVAKLPCSNDWNNKISWLFNLRNELVHGGSRYIEEWPQYMPYYRHFSTDPAHDIEKLAYHALASAPQLFIESNK